ncbi:hypothetical protein, partial [Sulfoacidibacillus ferrooxidans]|uniref:hypothetical protein n=1 Tax=Sulfoacidibacillus ferrooxidans TaxID=2005001 RepID=UPI001F506BE0
YRERLRAETAQFRTGGYLFYGVLAGSLLVAYPFAKSYMSGTVQVVFWLVLGIMTVGLQLVIRRSQVIDV